MVVSGEADIALMRVYIRSGLTDYRYWYHQVYVAFRLEELIKRTPKMNLVRVSGIDCALFDIDIRRTPDVKAYLEEQLNGVTA